MQASDSHPMESDAPRPESVSTQFKQLLAIILILGAVVILWAVFSIQREISRQRAAKNWSLTEFGLATPYQNRLAGTYRDQNHDLIADCPEDPKGILVPETIVFSYIGGSLEDQDSSLWEPLIKVLEEKTSRPVEHRQFPDIESQLLEMRSQALHVTALNTGTIPRAVNACGFVPLFASGEAGKTIGLSTKFIVPQGSTLKAIQDLKGRRITFTSEDSNSGFKAPVVILNSDFGMRPGLEYHYGFSTSHEESIRLIKKNEVAAAPVASDMLQRAMASGKISEDDFRVIYESEQFPPAVFGCLYSLDPKLQQQIREAFQACSLQDTQLGAALGATHFVPIDYKNDFALIRRIDDALGIKHDITERLVSTKQTTNATAGDELEPTGAPSEQDAPDKQDATDEQIIPEGQNATPQAEASAK